MIYDEEYRHFDQIIWQVPTWAMAIAAGSVLAAWEVGESGNTIRIANADALILLFGGINLSALAMVVCKARIHQTAALGGKALGFQFSFGPSAGNLLQGATCISAGILLGLCAVAFINNWGPLLFGLASGVAYWVYCHSLHSRARDQLLRKWKEAQVSGSVP